MSGVPMRVVLHDLKGDVTETLRPTQVAVDDNGVTILDKTGLRSFKYNSVLYQWQDTSYPYEVYSILDVLLGA